MNTFSNGMSPLIQRRRGRYSVVAGTLLLLWIPLLLAGVAQEAQAQAPVGGGLQVLPTRIVFEGRARSQQVTLINNGAEANTYRVLFKNMRMTDAGQYEGIEDVKDARPGEQFAEKLIRYSPRQVTLKPGERQTVRLLLRKPKGLAPGEYRSHMLFQTVPPENLGESLEDLGTDKDKISIALIPIFGISIPIIVRHGKGEADVKIGGFAMKAPKKAGGSPVLSMAIKRDGEMSAFGDIDVTVNSGGEEQVVGIVRGLAVYTPNKIRRLDIELNPQKGVALRNKKLHIVYKAVPEAGGAVLASGDFLVP